MGQRLAPQEIQARRELWSSGAISHETLLKQLAEGEILGDDFDVEEEIEKTQKGDMIETDEPTPEAEENEPVEDPDDED